MRAGTPLAQPSRTIRSSPQNQQHHRITQRPGLSQPIPEEVTQDAYDLRSRSHSYQIPEKQHNRQSRCPRVVGDETLEQSERRPEDDERVTLALPSGLTRIAPDRSASTPPAASASWRPISPALTAAASASNCAFNSASTILRLGLALM